MDVSVGSIERAWKACGYDDFWLRFRTSHADALTAVRDAALEADEAAASDGFELGAMTVGPCPGGVAVEIGPALEREPIHTWVRHFADALQRHGLSGSLGGAVQARAPRILGAELNPTPTLFARFGIPSRHDASRPDWAVAPDQTRRVVHTILDWALTEPGTVILAQGAFFMEVDGIELQTPMERGLHSAGSAGVDVVDERAQRARHAHLGHVADGLFQSIGSSALNTVSELHDLATRLSQPLDIAFVRIAHRGSAGINAIDTVQPLPGIGELQVRYNMHLLNRYVPDAHGIQVVTTAHLHAARDLSEWTITDLGRDRYLVVAPDLAAWYSSDLPDQDTLEQARGDWAGAILTEDLIASSRLH